MLAHSGELTYAQMAEVLNVLITTMQIRLVRARQMIRDQIAGKSRRCMKHEVADDRLEILIGRLPGRRDLARRTAYPRPGTGEGRPGT